MSLHRVRDRLFTADYKPHTAAPPLSLGSLFDYLSRRAQTLLHLVWAEARLPQQADLSDLLTIPALTELSSGMVLEEYRQLEDDEQAEVLGAMTFDLHELTHHLDLLTTPFGANFHCRACNEYIEMQRFVPEVLSAGAPGLDMPLVDWEPPVGTYVAPGLLDAWRSLRRKLYYFDALRGARGTRLTAGWHNDREEELVIARQRLRKVRVHGFMYSVEIPGERGSYLSPRTILESRAVAHSMRHILRLMGMDEFACEQVRLYLNRYYPRHETAPEYTFLFDLVACVEGHDTFDGVLGSSCDNVDRFLNVISALGWYALQAPPMLDTSQAALENSSPVVRWLHSLHAARDVMRAPPSASYDALGVALEALDEQGRAGGAEIPPINASLERTAQYVAHARERNRNHTADPVMCAHFERLLSTLEHQLEGRVGSGYESDIGMPLSGNPGFMPAGSRGDWTGLGYRAPDPAVRDWFGFRENLVFRLTPSLAERRERLDERFA